jgi:LmbE family N-acetylglucosaminyl deacetylase
MFEKVLVIAPHSDDDILGCGGLMKKVKNLGGEVHVIVTTIGDVAFYHKPDVVKAEVREEEFYAALDFLGVDKGEILFRHSEQRLHLLPIVDIITAYDQKIRTYKPTAVFIPYPSFHQDHKTVFDASFAALRPTPNTSYVRLVAMYEYPFVVWDVKDTDGNRFHLDISDVIDDKINAMKCHKSQIREAEHLISPQTIRVWAERRGIEVGVPYAEAFKALRMVF